MMQASHIIIPSMLCSLLIVDFFLGNGLLNLLLRWAARMIDFVRRIIRVETQQMVVENLIPINIPVLLSEALFLTLLTAILSRFGNLVSKDSIDKLLLESRDKLKTSNEYMDRWQRRRLALMASVNIQVLMEHSYLDENPHPIAPLKLDVPILHMAIIDTRGTSRGSLERGDAGDVVSDNESALLSMTSLLDDDSMFFGADPVEEQTVEEREALADNSGRRLWNVLEEDTDDLELRSCHSE